MGSYPERNYLGDVCARATDKIVLNEVPTSEVS